MRGNLSKAQDYQTLYDALTKIIQTEMANLLIKVNIRNN